MRRILITLLALALAGGAEAQVRVDGGSTLTSQQSAANVGLLMQNAVTANGNGTLMSVTGMARVVLTVNCASCSGGTTVIWEGTEDGTNYAGITAHLLGQLTPTIGFGTTTAGVTMWSVPVAGLVTMRARVTAYSAGTVTVTGHATPITDTQNSVIVSQPSGSNVSVMVGGVNGGSAASFGAGASGTTTLRVVTATDSTTTDTATSATGSAPPAKAGYVGGVTSGATGGLLAGVTVCDSQAFLDMTTATTTELVALTASRKVYVCYWLAESNGTTVMTFKRGTGTNCGTGTTTISNAWDLAAQVGFSGGGGMGAIFDNQNAGDALCVTSSAAVNLHIYVRYAKY